MGGDAGGQNRHLKEFDELAERAIYHTDARKGAEGWSALFGGIGIVLLIISFWKSTFNLPWLLSIVLQFSFIGLNFYHSKKRYEVVVEMHELGEQLGMSEDQIHARLDKVLLRNKQR